MKQSNNTRTNANVPELRIEGGAGVSSFATVKEAAEFFKVDPSTVRRWVSQGVLRAFRIGKTTLRVDLASVKAEPVGLAA